MWQFICFVIDDNSLVMDTVYTTDSLKIYVTQMRNSVDNIAP